MKTGQSMCSNIKACWRELDDTSKTKVIVALAILACGLGLFSSGVVLANKVSSGRLSSGLLISGTVISYIGWLLLNAPKVRHNKPPHVHKQPADADGDIQLQPLSRSDFKNN